MNRLSFPHYVQQDVMDCCSTCLRIIAKYYGKTYKYNANKFFSKYEMNVSEVEKEHVRHKAWKERCGFNATPTILVNGYPLPEEYTVEDLEFI